ncbi:MAG: hypothetical protein ABUS56_11940 [Acidobacteriota bacterium]
MPALDRTALVLRLRQRLRAAANPDGGWPYYAGKASRIEPTAWVLLALTESSDAGPAARGQFIAPPLRLLETRQRGDGLLLDNPQAPPNFTANGVAACVLAHLSDDAQAASVLARLVGGLVAAKGVAIRTPLLDAIAAMKRLGAPRTAPGQDNTLQAWPWIPDTFSWAEPTSWCLLALKKARGLRTQAAEARVGEAEALLANRACASGGWNYGNASAFAQDLRPYVPTTAVALIALQDRAAQPAVVRSLAFLDRSKLAEPSGFALGLAAMALSIYDRDVTDVEDRLAADVERAERIGNLQTLAVALYALSSSRHQWKAMRV